VSAEDTSEGDEMSVEPRTGSGDATETADTPYTRGEWMDALVPAILVVAVLVLVLVVWYLAGDEGPIEQGLDDVDENGSFNLQGQWVEDLTAYGTQAASINLTLDEGDRLSLSYSAHGPPDGIQVRLQHPLHPSDGANGTGGTRVFASSVGGNGTIELFVQEGGAYQLYFWHPGSTKMPGPDDDPDDHTLAAVSYHLVVIRAHRP
jgi:hypothetical protein